jgi:NAD(P)H-hydrate epimerase
VIVDGLIGFSLQGAPRGRAAELIEWTNSNKTPVISLDTPSGLDASTGEIFAPCVKATTTVVFGLMKRGLLSKDAQRCTGEVLLVDIGLPKTFPKHLLDPVQ